MTTTIQAEVRWVDGKLMASIGARDIELGSVEESPKYGNEDKIETFAVINDWLHLVWARVQCADIDEAKAVVVALLGVRGLRIGEASHDGQDS